MIATILQSKNHENFKLTFKFTQKSKLILESSNNKDCSEVAYDSNN